MFEILHFLPALALALAFFFGFYKSLKANYAVLSLSLFGIMVGSVFHCSHAVTMFDPCIISITVAIYSALNVVRLTVLSKKKA